MSRDGRLLNHDRDDDAGNETGRGEAQDPRGPLGCSDLWSAYVEARDNYRKVSLTRSHDFAAVVEAREEMNEAYRRWSES